MAGRRQQLTLADFVQRRLGAAFPLDSAHPIQAFLPTSEVWAIRWFAPRLDQTVKALDHTIVLRPSCRIVDHLNPKANQPQPAKKADFALTERRGHYREVVLRNPLSPIGS